MSLIPFAAELFRQNMPRWPRTIDCHQYTVLEVCQDFRAQTQPPLDILNCNYSITVLILCFYLIFSEDYDGDIPNNNTFNLTQ